MKRPLEALGQTMTVTMATLHTTRSLGPRFWRNTFTFCLQVSPLFVTSFFYDDGIREKGMIHSDTLQSPLRHVLSLCVLVMLTAISGVSTLILYTSATL